MNPFVRFMASTTGRALRIVAGVALIAWGALGLGGWTGVAVALIGAVPFLAGVIDICVFAPLFNDPIKGAEIRADS